MGKMMSKLGNTKIRTKLICSHILIALIPFLLVGMVGIVFSVKEAEKNVNQHTTQTVNQISQTLDIYMGDIEKVVNMMTAMIEDTDLVGSGEQNGDEEAIRDEMKRLMDTHDEIAGILYASADDRYVSTGMTRIARDSFQKEQWYKKACENADMVHIISTVTGRNIMTDVGYSVDDVFSVVKAVRNSATGEIAGVLLLDVRHTIISSAIRDALIGSEGFVFVLDEADHMVYTPINEVVYRIRSEWLEDETEPLNAGILGDRYHIRFKTSAYTGWKVVSVASFGEVMGDINQMIAIYTIMLVLTLVLVFYMSVRLADTITRPVLKLRNLMKQTEKGDLSLRFEGEGQDELSELGRKFNHMLEQIQGLLNKVYEEEEEKRQAQLKIVQEQFKPHFLYNTLDAINWMAREHGVHDIVKLVEALTNVFRISLSKGRDYIEIREEVSYVSSYLYIQQTRYGDKVLYEIEVDESCYPVMVPKLILQPLVENAIYHGVKLKRHAGRLRVEIKREEENIIALSVSDDGKGMDIETTERLRRMLGSGEKKEGTSFGLFYVKERLSLKYGNAYSVQVESAEDEGTTITIRIPAE